MVPIHGPGALKPMFSRTASGRACKMRLCSRRRASNRTKTLRVDPVHFGHAGIDFLDPGYKASLSLDQRCLILHQGGQAFLQPSIARVIRSGHGVLPHIGFLATAVSTWTIKTGVRPPVCGIE